MHLGSETFNTEVIKTDEYVLLAQTMVENGMSLEEASLDIQAIDDMLRMQKMQSVINTNRFTATGRLRKDSALRDFINRRIDILLEDHKSGQDSSSE